MIIVDSVAIRRRDQVVRHSSPRWMAAAGLWLLGLSAASAAGEASYVGGSACAVCHEKESGDWNNSHHDLAMMEADPQSVLGDFNDAKFSQFGIMTDFFRRDGAFMVRTDGPKGKLEEYPIAYTFGIFPLQQYLVEFPGGRLQALDIAWDSRPVEEGGQRWFHLHPEQKIPNDDPLHWTGPNLNWNYMCADCHSTNLRKNYDEKYDSYDTSWSEIDVSCEACHGPGSKHVDWAEAHKESGTEPKAGSDMGLTVRLDERAGVSWAIDADTKLPHRSTPRTTNREIEICARCHSRRSQLSDDVTPGKPLLDNFRPALLHQGLYHADGQIEDEVYVYGSFLQSKMYQAGVTCSDCHDPHRADTKAPGDGACYQCHEAGRYTDNGHHFHEPGSEGASCVECHMPASTYMGVDDRHDHSMRIPRPDLSVSLGTPNACNKCHADQTTQWAADQAQAWYGKPGDDQKYAGAFDAARRGQAKAEPLLRALAQDVAQQNIVRATSLSLLGSFPSPANRNAIQFGMQDEDPQLRLAALEALEGLGPRAWLQAMPLLQDDIRAVRIEAARMLAGQPRDRLPPRIVEMLNSAIGEYIAAQNFSAERPESRVNLGGIYTTLGDYGEAEAAYRQAINLQPWFVPAYVNLAQMLNTRQREQEAESFLLAGLEQVPDSADLNHALGLSLVRQKKNEQALTRLEQAAKLNPDNVRYGYVYAVALQAAGKLDPALRQLAGILDEHPDNPDILYALATFNRDAGRPEEARRYARELKKRLPGDPAIDGLLQELDAGK